MLPHPPVSLLDDASLFLDFDGTLVDLVDRPDQVVADPELRALLADLDTRMEGRLAVISGRSIAQLDAMLGAVAQQLALAGSHGCEQRHQGELSQPERPASLDRAAERLIPFVDRHPGALIETKSYGVALHYRLRPEAEEEAAALAVELARDLGLQLQAGKMMVELRVPGCDKGDAVRRLTAQAPMKGSRPIVIGDDRTDENAFLAAATMGGASILVGPPRETAAQYRLDDPRAVRAWLREALA